jgi:hypothetical protein
VYLLFAAVWFMLTPQFLLLQGLESDDDDEKKTASAKE